MFTITPTAVQKGEANGCKDAAVFASFMTTKDGASLTYSVNLLPPDPANFKPFEELSPEDLEKFIRAKMGQGATMTEAQFEAELDAAIAASKQ